MPLDGRRKKILVAARDGIKAATGADYFNSYAAAGVCELGREPDISMLEGAQPYALRIYDGFDRQTLAGGQSATGNLEVIIAGFVKGTAPTLVERVQDIIADLTLIVYRNASLGGTCTFIGISSIDPPSYRDDQAYFAMRLGTTYEYTAGVDR